MSLMDFIMQFKTELWTIMSDFIISSAVIAIIASLFTEAIKISIEKVFIQRETPKIFGWLMNSILVLVASIFFVILFGNKVTLLGIVLYTTLIFFLSWAISILAYALIIKLFVTILKILYSKTKCYYVAAETEVINTTILYSKTKELMGEHIALDKLQDKVKESDGGRP